MINRVLNPSGASSLARKMALILFAIFALSTFVAMILLNQIFTIQASSQINRQSNLFMDSMLAVREYTSNKVNPIIAPLNKEGIEFRPEAVPSYAATTVFAYLKAKPEYASFSYREATLNPTNLKDKADALESAVIQDFRANPDLKLKTGIRTTPVGDFHYIAKPITISKQSCLACHSTPSLAPQSQILTYGANSGFGWKLGETVGAQIVTVPINEITKARDASMLWTSLLLAFTFLLVALATTYSLNQLILKPMRKMSALANEASVSPGSVVFEEKGRSDEIGTLAKSFDRMKQSLVISMQMLKNRDG